MCAPTRRAPPMTPPRWPRAPRNRSASPRREAGPAGGATAGARTVEEGVVVADRATAAIERLQHAGESSATAARDIAGAAERQHAGMDRITAAITQAGATSSSLAGAAGEAQE